MKASVGVASALGIVARTGAARHTGYLLALLLLLFIGSVNAHAQVASRISIAASGPATTQPFSLATNPTVSQSLSITTSWTFFLGVTLDVCVSMTAPLTGTGGNSDTIPATAVQLNNVSIVAAGQTNCGIANASRISHTAYGFSFGPSRTDTVNVRIAGFPPSLAADTYQGTITVIAVAY